MRAFYHVKSSHPHRPMSDPPFHIQYAPLFSRELLSWSCETPRECELPMVDLSHLRSGNPGKRRACESAMAKAAGDWGFFQVVNHGISHELLQEMRREQRRLFALPFERKSGGGLFDGFYRWGNPTATSLRQFSWSEAFHVPLDMIIDGKGKNSCDPEFVSLRDVMRRLAEAMSELAFTIATALVRNLGSSGQFLTESCSTRTSFLRLNRYPPCRLSPSAVFGLTPHTDSDYLTILWQDEVGGLQLMKDSRWVAVKPNPRALIVNIGDLLQAWSNDVYKSVEHRVVTNGSAERHSFAYFLCPSGDCSVGSCAEPSAYRNFTFGEYRRQVQEDVSVTGQKVGLPRFRIS